MAVYEIYSFPAGYGTINAELERNGCGSTWWSRFWLFPDDAVLKCEVITEESL
jgi:hypothetical protein